MTCQSRGPTDAYTLTELVLERARYEYAEHADNWKVLESKAQTTAAAAGLFLAAIVTVAGTDPVWLDRLIPRILASLVVVSLTAAVVFSMLSLWVTELETPTSAQSIWTMVQAATSGAAADEDHSTKYREVIEIFIRDWLKAVDVIESKSDEKAKWITHGQRALVFGAVAAAVFAGVSVWT